MKTFKGKVISNKREKTATILVETRRPHPLYKKIIVRRKKFAVHDELGVEIGDQVEIVETRPISKTKKWRILKNLSEKKKKVSKKTGSKKPVRKAKEK